MQLYWAVGSVSVSGARRRSGDTRPSVCHPYDQPSERTTIMSSSSARATEADDGAGCEEDKRGGIRRAQQDFASLRRPTGGARQGGASRGPPPGVTGGDPDESGLERVCRFRPSKPEVTRSSRVPPTSGKPWAYRGSGFASASHAAPFCYPLWRTVSIEATVPKQIRAEEFPDLGDEAMFRASPPRSLSGLPR